MEVEVKERPISKDTGLSSPPRVFLSTYFSIPDLSSELHLSSCQCRTYQSASMLTHGQKNKFFSRRDENLEGDPYRGSFLLTSTQGVFKLSNIQFYEGCPTESLKIH